MRRDLQLFYKEDILKFWENSKIQMSELYDLSNINFEVSATQAMLEREFSALGFILSSVIENLSATTLNDILLF